MNYIESKQTPDLIIQKIKKKPKKPHTHKKLLMQRLVNLYVRLRLL